MTRIIPHLDRLKAREDALQNGVSEVLYAINEVTGYELKDLRDKCRREEIAMVRHAFVFVVLERDKFGMTLSGIGRVINRNHCTVLASRKVAKDLISTHKPFRTLVENIKSKLSRNSMTETEATEAIAMLETQLYILKQWLANNHENPYRLKVMTDVRSLESEKETIQKSVVTNQS